MKIPSISIRPNYIHFERMYESDKVIVPIGGDCHPAYLLKMMHLRECSLPFDWLGIQPETTFAYVLDCIQTKFSKTFSDMDFNEKRQVISRNYPTTKFNHEACVVHNKYVVDMFKSKGKLFNELIEKYDVYYLCNIKVTPFKDKEMADKFVWDIVTFTEFMKEKDSLHIYFTSDSDENENYDLREYLLSKIRQIEKVKVIYYYKNMDKYGLWGDIRYYPTILKQLGINIRKTYRIKVFTTGRR